MRAVDMSRTEITQHLEQALALLAASRQAHPEWLRVNGFIRKGETQ